MSENALRCFGLAVLLCFLLGAPSCWAYKYRECKRIGHESLYCLMQAGR